MLLCRRIGRLRGAVLFADDPSRSLLAGQGETQPHAQTAHSCQLYACAGSTTEQNRADGATSLSLELLKSLTMQDDDNVGSVLVRCGFP